MNKSVIVVLGGLLFCAASRGDIVFSDGVDNTGTDNVLFNGIADILGPARVVQGHIQNTTTNVSVASDERLVVNTGGAGGQAAISAQTPGFASADIYFTNPPGGTYGKIVFALSGYGTGKASQVPFIVTVTEGNGETNSAPYTTGSGNTFYTIVAIKGQDIRNINLKTDTGYEFDTLSQLRIGPSDATVPDGGKTLMLMGGALVVLQTLRRRLRL